MFDPQIYAARRAQLRGALDGGVVLLPAAAAMPRTYADNVYPYRQSAHLLYYLGLTDPGLFLVSYPAEGRDVLYGDPVTMDDVIWCGPKASLEERASLAGIDEVARRISWPSTWRRSPRAMFTTYLPSSGRWSPPWPGCWGGTDPGCSRDRRRPWSRPWPSSG